MGNACVDEPPSVSSALYLFLEDGGLGELNLHLFVFHGGANGTCSCEEALLFGGESLMIGIKRRSSGTIAAHIGATSIAVVELPFKMKERVRQKDNESIGSDSSVTITEDLS
jgi:hypothetical protein